MQWLFSLKWEREDKKEKKRKGKEEEKEKKKGKEGERGERLREDKKKKNNNKQDFLATVNACCSGHQLILVSCKYKHMYT